MDRADLLAILLTPAYHQAAVEIGQTTDDTVAGWKTVIDQALRQSGVAEADLATWTTDDPNLINAVLVRLDVYALEQLVRGFALAIDISVGQGALSFKRSQIRDGLLALLRLARERLATIEAMVGTGRRPVVDVITQTAPLQVDDGVTPDPNHRVYRGDPLYRPPTNVPRIS